MLETHVIKTLVELPFSKIIAFCRKLQPKDLLLYRNNIVFPFSDTIVQFQSRVEMCDLSRNLIFT